VRSLAAAALLLAACAAPAEREDAPLGPHPDSDASAVALARDVLERMGGADAWARTRHLHWRFFGGRAHWWDRRTDRARIESEGLTLLIDLRTRAGRAWRDGSEIVEGAELAELLERGYAWWVNDSYWVLMPYKLCDPGVRLADRGSEPTEAGRAARVLALTFEGVGLTPENRYLVWVADESGLVEQWAFFRNASDEEPAFVMPWSGWQRFGRILLATEHGRGRDWDLAVFDELPERVYLDPAPVAAEHGG
jgi:hypothetical protein